MWSAGPSACMTVCSDASSPFAFSFYDFVVLFNLPHLFSLVLPGIVRLYVTQCLVSFSLCLLAHRGLNLVVNRIVLSDRVVYYKKKRVF